MRPLKSILLLVLAVLGLIFISSIAIPLLSGLIGISFLLLIVFGAAYQFVRVRSCPRCSHYPSKPVPSKDINAAPPRQSPNVERLPPPPKGSGKFNFMTSSRSTRVNRKANAFGAAVGEMIQLINHPGPRKCSMCGQDFVR